MDKKARITGLFKKQIMSFGKRLLSNFLDLPPSGEQEGGIYHLGIITHVTDASGNVVNEYNFDAWGRRRDKDDWSYTLTSEPSLLADRGFTGHEYLPWFKLYNMNGRLYDPVVGRFLEPDPVVQNAFSTQNLNRYSYALNNPLKYVDPSGNRMLQDMQNWYDGTGTGFWYRGDYYNQDGNGNWTGSFSGNAPGGGSPGGSTFGIGTGNAGPSFEQWQKKKESENITWIQMGFFYYDANGNPLTINGNNGQFWIFEANQTSAINSSNGAFYKDPMFYINSGIGVAGIGATIKGGYHLSNELYHYTRSSRNLHIIGSKYWNNPFVNNSKAAIAARGGNWRVAGTKLGYAGIAVTTIDAFASGEFKASQGVNIAMTTLAIAVPGVGSIVAGLYFATDLGFTLTTGRGIGDRIDSSTGGIHELYKGYY